jgi:hypothetical protein
MTRELVYTSSREMYLKPLNMKEYNDSKPT